MVDNQNTVFSAKLSKFQHSISQNVNLIFGKFNSPTLANIFVIHPARSDRSLRSGLCCVLGRDVQNGKEANTNTAKA